MSGKQEETPGYYNESVLWQGSPSQWLNLGNFIFFSGLWAISLFMWVAWHLYGLSNSYSEYSNQYSALVLSFALMPPVFMLWCWLKLRSERITITMNKITESSGVTAIFRKEKYCEIADVVDVTSPPAGWLALVGRATLILHTKDKDQPTIKIKAIKNRDQLRDRLMPLIRRLTVERKTYFASG